jgi:hypothetical protein
MRVGAFLRDVPPVFTREMPVSFDPVQTTFLQKLVREGVLKANVTVEKRDFFKGIVYLDHFTGVIAGRDTLLEDVSVIVEELEKMHEYLDVDLELLVRYSGLYAKNELKGGKLFEKAAAAEIARRHEKTNARPVDAPAGDPTAVDLFHRAVARMVLDLVRTDEARAALPAIQGRNDLKAAIFADAILGALPPAEVPAEAVDRLAEGRVHDAAVLLAEALVRSSAGWSLRSHVDAIRARLAP